MAKKDFYKILKVDPKSSLKEIKSAYRQLALKYHPDHNPENPDAAEMFAIIKEAYEVLTTADLRKSYDFDYTPSRREPTVQPQKPTGPVESKKKGKNLRYNLYISLEDVSKGCERGIRYIRKNKNESETIQLKVKVPKGAFDNQRLKLTNYGDTDQGGSGDLFVIIHLHDHPIFLKNDLNLRVNVPVSYLDVMLGSMIEVPTLNGIKKIKLKACEFDDLETTMKGFGLPDHKGHFKGDLLVHFFIEHPRKLSTAEKNAVQKGLRTWPQGEMMQQYQNYLKQQKGG